MSTLMLDETIVPVAKHMAEGMRLSTVETASYVAGFVEGYALRIQNQADSLARLTETTEFHKARANHLWTALIETMLLLPDDHPALEPVYRALHQINSI